MIYTVPFAGGSKYSYLFLDRFFTQNQVVHLELPGRGQRSSELLLTRFDQAVDDIFKQIEKINTSCVTLFGHSLGALISFKVAHKLEKAQIKIDQLVVSGNVGFTKHYGRDVNNLGQDEFKTKLKALNGIPEELLNNDPFFSAYEPILRADFQLANDAFAEKVEKITAPITAIMGDKEECASEIGNWKSYTTSSCVTYILEGDHFFIYKWGREIADLVNTGIKQHSQTAE